MKLISWNVNSLRSAETSFLNFIKTHQPEIFLLQELRANPNQLSFFLQLIPGYKAIFNPSGKLGYGGTAIYYQDHLPITDVSTKTGNPILDSEGRCIKVRLKNISIFNFYTPNGNRNQQRLNYKLQFYQEIINLAGPLIQKRQQIIIGGDLNVGHTPLDLYAPQANQNHSGFLPSERHWFDEMLALGFIDSFRLFKKSGGYYTWWHMRDRERKANKGWRFDYFLVSKNLKTKIRQAAILKDIFGSDHCPILLDINL